MSKQARVLVVEDEADIRELLILHLCRKGYTVTGVESGEMAIESINSARYDLLILDWMLPGKSGVEIIEYLKQHNDELPAILMVTARAEPEFIVEGLQAGADDYLTKPFDPSVLGARCEALLRRRSESTRSTQLDELIQVAELKIRPEYFEVECQGELIHLTKSEFKLLYALAKNEGRVLSRDRLIELVQGEGIMVIDRTIDTHVFSLRKKLGACAGIIETIHGIGYRVNAKKFKQ